MKFLDLFRAGPDAATKVLDTGIAGIDKIVYTEEEKADARQKLLDTWIELQKTLGGETSVRGVTRRILTFLTVLPYTLLILVAAVMYYYNVEYANFLVNLADGKFGLIVATIVVFYFGPMVGRILGKA